MNTIFIRTTLKKSRKQMERYVSKNTCMSPTELDCMCGISSYILFLFFKKAGYNPTFCMNDYHCFLRIEDYWIDLTLKQFNIHCPKIYFHKHPYTQNDGYGNIHRCKQTAKTLRKVRRLFRGWPPEQNPFKLSSLPKITA